MSPAGSPTYTLKRAGATRHRRGRSRRAHAAEAATAFGFLVVALLAGCGGSSPEGSGSREPASAKLSPALTSLLRDSGRVVGGRDSTSPDGLLAHVLHARILPGGAVLADDKVSPHLRVFDPDGHLLATALPKGEGPEEGGYVYGLDVSNTGHVMALIDRGLREYLWTGDSLTFISAYRLPQDRLLVTLGSRCGRGWIAYAPPLRARNAPILEVAVRDDVGGLSWRPELPWSTEVDRLWLGSPYQIVSDSAHVYLRHRYHPRAPILEIPCDGPTDSTTVLRDTREGPPADHSREAESGSIIRYPFPDTLYTGFTVREGVLVESERIRTDVDTDWTVVSVSPVSDVTQRRSVLVPGGWWVMDARAGFMLLYTEDPAPRLVRLSLDALVRTVRHDTPAP